MGNTITSSILSVVQPLRFHQPYAANTNGPICLNSEVSVFLQPPVSSPACGPGRSCAREKQDVHRAERQGSPKEPGGLLHPPGTGCLGTTCQAQRLIELQTLAMKHNGP